jgi:hypothetical protein
LNFDLNRIKIITIIIFGILFCITNVKMGFECSSRTQIVVVAKNILQLTNLYEKNNQVVSYSGLLFDIWDEIAKANNYT